MIVHRKFRFSLVLLSIFLKYSLSLRPNQCDCVPYHMCYPGELVMEGTSANYGLIDTHYFEDPVCVHYLEVCCDKNNTLTESIAPQPMKNHTNRPKGCGIRNVGGIDFNITGTNDNESGFGEFPWTVAILHAKNYSYFCAGSLIHPRVVLTAAHCVVNRPPTSFIVRAGEWDSQTDKERLPYQERTAERILTHPQYTLNRRNIANDFALVILSSPIELSDHINVVCLPSQNATPPTRSTCISTGWGKDVFGAVGRYSAIMKGVPLSLVDFNDCQAKLRSTRLGAKFALDPSFICASGQRGTDTCQGDGGSPLVCPIGIAKEYRYQQSGIVSWGIGCNNVMPAMFGNVSMARNWIDEEMLANGYDNSSYTDF